MYDVAPDESTQSNVTGGINPVAPFAGERREKLPGVPHNVVNDHVPLAGIRVVPPHEFVATMYQ